MANVESVSQAGALLIGSIIFYMIALLGLGAVVDLFVYDVAGELSYSPMAQVWLGDIIIYGQWFYFIVKALIAIVVLWFFIFIIKRHRYNRQRDEYDWYDR